MTSISDINHFHLCAGSGSGAAGMQDAAPAIPGLQGRMVCRGGIDVDPAGAADFKQLTGVSCTVRDLFDLQQYVDFHGHMPPPGWQQVVPEDLRVAASHHRPNIVFISAPCKGFSGLLPKSRSASVKYIALNRLTLRAVWLMLEAWADDPPEVILFENVPLIASRGRVFLDQIIALLRHYGFVVRETFHDCGELGGLAQSRRRFLMIARHSEKMPAFIYEPPRRPLRSVGEVLGRYGLPGDPAEGPMHRIPQLNWKTWVRLAFVEAGKDWRSLNRLAVEDGRLRDFLIVPEMRNGVLGVRSWSDSSGVVPAASRPANGAFSVADPRAAAGAAQYQQYGVMNMQETAGAVIGVKSPGQGTFSVADPRHSGPAKHSNEFRIVRYDEVSRAVTGAHGTGQCVADPRGGQGFAKYGVTGYADSANAVIGGSTTGQGAYAVADPRPGMVRERGDNYLTGGHYGVVDPDQPAGAVSAAACHDNGRWSVADRRYVPTDASALGEGSAVGTRPTSDVPENVPSMPAPGQKLVAVIRALDGTWHRPFTTLDLAALQSLYDPDDYAEAAEDHRHFVLHGGSDQAWRERIGNAVPRKAAKAMAEEIGRAILLSRAGESFQLSSTPIWVRPIATAFAVRGGEGA